MKPNLVLEYNQKIKIVNADRKQNDENHANMSLL